MQQTDLPGENAHGGRRLAVALVVALAVTSLPFLASAQSSGSNAMIAEQLERIPTGEQGVDQIMQPMETRLELTTEQVGEIRPIVTEMVGNFESAKGKFESGEYTVMKMMMELNVQGERAATRVESYLSETQLAEYKAMRSEQKMRMMEERRKAMQQMMKARQAAAASDSAP
jgi:hypothetical protein